MAYTPHTWVDDVDKITAARMNAIESGIAALGLTVAATVSASATLAVGKFTPADATTAARTMTLPTGAGDGVTLGVEKVDASANAVSVTGNIRGVPATTIALPWQHETLVLRADSAGSWWPVAGHKTKASLDAAYRTVVDTAPYWAVLTGYKAGQYVVKDGHLLCAKVDHTSSSTYGGFTAANWDDLGAYTTPTPQWITLRGSQAGADVYDSNPHLIIESYQRPQTGPFGETIRFHAMQPQSKQMISWWFATNPARNPDPATNPLKQMVWLGAHYGAQDDADGVHGHISIEVPDSTGALRSRFGVDFLNNRQGSGSPGVVGADVTSSYFANTDVSHRQGSGEVFRITSGAGSAERVIEFSAAGQVAGQPPGYFDTTKRRWQIVANQDTESGSAAGSNLLIRRFDDTGTSSGTAMFVSRATGTVTFGQASTQGAQVSVVYAGGSQHGFLSAPSASQASGFAHFAAKSVAAGDRALDIRVSGDAAARLKSDSNGKLEWSNGTASDTTLERKVTGVLGVGATHAFRTGVAATASRPSASGVGQGSQFFDSTLNKPIWSTGSAWVDATGAAV